MSVGTVDRVARVTNEKVNERIRRQTACNISYYTDHPDEIPARLRELDGEWDVERWLETQGSVLAIVGAIFGAFFNRKWLILTTVVMSFLLFHTIQGWCPPIPMIRRMGFRTQREIEEERRALLSAQGGA